MNFSLFLSYSHVDSSFEAAKSDKFKLSIYDNYKMKLYFETILSTKTLLLSEKKTNFVVENI